MDKKRFDLLKKELFDWAAENEDTILSPGDDVLERVKAMSSMLGVEPIKTVCNGMLTEVMMAAKERSSEVPLIVTLGTLINLVALAWAVEQTDFDGIKRSAETPDSDKDVVYFHDESVGEEIFEYIKQRIPETYPSVVLVTNNPYLFPNDDYGNPGIGWKITTGPTDRDTDPYMLITISKCKFMAAIRGKNNGKYDDEWHFFDTWDKALDVFIAVWKDLNSVELTAVAPAFDFVFYDPECLANQDKHRPNSSENPESPAVITSSNQIQEIHRFDSDGKFSLIIAADTSKPIKIYNTKIENGNMVPYGMPYIQDIDYCVDTFGVNVFRCHNSSMPKSGNYYVCFDKKAADV